ncbi:MAG: putative Signal transduction histidine kinase [Chloroflexi bacterium]|nr:putative Signal transduction histidine kinase [Chloroflexota bacterium]
MSSNYAYTPTIWPSILTVLLLIALSIYSGRRRSVPGALPFAIGSLFAALWAFGSVMEVAAVDVQVKIFWLKFQGVWQLPTATATTCFILEYAWPGRWLTRRNLVLLSIPCLLSLGVILTNDLHHLTWRGFVYDGTVIPLRGPSNWVLFAYGYGLGIVNLIVLAWLFLRSPQHRWPVAIMLTGMLVGRVHYLLEAARILQSNLLMNVPQVAFEYLIYAVALFGFHILDPITLARQAVIDQMREGMLVLDLQGRVTSMNLSAERILGESTGHLKGQPVDKLLPAIPDGHFDVTKETEIELNLPEEQEDDMSAGQAVRHYTLEVSALKDWRGLEVGRLLLLHDVTEQKRAQAQLMEQQRALAMLQEREQLARELHDTLGQVFVFVNTQGQTIRRLLSQGDIATADEYTNRLVEVAREADVDIRESILGLRVALSAQGFFPVLVEYLAQYEKNYGIYTELERPETMLDAVFEPLIEAQLLRILQEALTNIRKHAGANHVRIAFASEDNCVRVTVQDDGLGFDPEAHSDPFSEHVGLRVMRERAEEVGGSLRVDSTPGRGTCVIVQIPVNSK